jgi:hypothetical protein
VTDASAARRAGSGLPVTVGRLTGTMDSTFAPSGRRLPPVPRPPSEDPVEGPVHPVREGAEGDEQDPAQIFVARLRNAAPEFAAAAGAQSAVVREVVPPARHRRSRCRLVLRFATGEESDVTFLGPVGRPGAETHAWFESSIRGWLGADPQREDAWLVPDDEAPDGVAVDVTAWHAAS